MSRRGAIAVLAGVLVVTLTPAVRAAGPSKAECIAANEGAQDLQRTGKLLEARSKLATCVATTCPGPVREDCASRLEALASQIPTLVFQVTDTNGADVTNLHMTIDGVPVDDLPAGTALEVNPGEHVLKFESPGLPAAEKKVVVRVGEKARTESIVLGKPRETPPVNVQRPRPNRAPTRPDEPPQTLRTLGIVGLAVGGASTLFGILAADLAMNARTVAIGHCNAGGCDATGSGAQSTQSTWTAVQATALIVGGLGLAGGITLLVLPSKSPSTSAFMVAPSPSGGALRWVGEF